jgi:TetR/AcrR family transcriptional regulator, tetracycline repressor protein
MSQLRREDVLAGALALLDAEGLDALTMRKLAASLDVQAGALYWHFGSKKALVDAMAERLVAGVGGPGTSGPGTAGGAWDEQLTELAIRLRQALLAHRDGARVITETACDSGGANTLLVGRTSTALLITVGFPPEQAVWLTFALIHYVLGQTMGEQARAEWVARGGHNATRAATDDDEDDAYLQARASALSADPDKQFAYALSVFLDGIKHRLPLPHPPPETSNCGSLVNA